MRPHLPNFNHQITYGLTHKAPYTTAPSLGAQFLAPLVEGVKGLHQIDHTSQGLQNHIHNLQIQRQSQVNNMISGIHGKQAELQNLSSALNRFGDILSGNQHSPVINAAAPGFRQNEIPEVTLLSAPPPARAAEEEFVQSQEYHTPTHSYANAPERTTEKGEPLLDKLATPASEFLESRIKLPDINDSRPKGRRRQLSPPVEPRDTINFPEIQALRKTWHLNPFSKKVWNLKAPFRLTGDKRKALNDVVLSGNKNDILSSHFSELYDIHEEMNSLFDEVKNHKDTRMLDYGMGNLKALLEEGTDSGQKSLTSIHKLFLQKPTNSDNMLYREEWNKVAKYATSLKKSVNERIRYLELKKLHQQQEDTAFLSTDAHFKKACEDAVSSYCSKFQKAYAKTFNSAKQEELVSHLRSQHDGIDQHYKNQIANLDEAPSTLGDDSLKAMTDERIKELKKTADTSGNFSVGRGLSIGGLGIVTSGFAAVGTHMLLGSWAATQVFRAGTAASLFGGMVATASESAWQKAGKGQFFEAAQDLYSAMWKKSETA